MAMVVKNNMSAISTLNTLNKNQSALKSSLEKVSSGMKINSAQDDASGYAISERMRAMIRSLDQANENTQNGNSLMKVAEGAVGNTVEILDTLKKKAIQAATDTNTDDDRKIIQKEIDQLIDQIDENALITYNGKYLLDGSRTQAGTATYTAMTNQKLAGGTTGATKIVDLANRKGESLQIIDTDQVQASFVRNGKTYTTTYDVSDTTLEDIFTALNDRAVAQGSKKAFGVANLSSETMTYTEAQSKIATDAGTSTDLVGILRDLSTDEAHEYMAAAAAIDNEGQLGASSDTYAYQDVKSAKTDLDKALEKYFNSITLETGSSQVAKANATLTLKIYDANGTATDKTYNFEGTASGATKLNALTSNEYTTMMADIKTSVANLVGAGTSSSGNGSDAYSLVSSNGLVNAIKNALNVTSATVAATATVLDSGTGTSADVKLKFGSIDMASGSVVANSTTAATLSTVNMTPNTADYAMANGDSTDSATSLWKAGNSNVTADLNDDITRYATGFALNKLSGLVYSGNEIGLDPSKHTVKTADNTVGLTITARDSGIDNQISGLTIKILDAQGQSRTAINEVLDAFGTTIFASSKSDDLTLKIHTGAEAGQALSVGLSDMRASALGLKGNDSEKVSVATQDKANAAISVFNNALKKALDIQTTIGAIEARLNYTSSNLTTATENITASESTIRDADMAKEMTEYTKNNVLLQAAQSMLAQANQNSSAVLSLLQ